MYIECEKTIAANYQPSKSKETNIMTKAIKAYKDELLTGLTDEEREEIDKKIREYLKDKPIKTKGDKQVLVNYIKSLLVQYGFKGNCEEYAGVLGASSINESKETNDEGVSSNDSDSMSAYKKTSSQGAVARIMLFE